MEAARSIVVIVFYPFRDTFVVENMTTKSKYILSRTDDPNKANGTPPDDADAPGAPITA